MSNVEKADPAARKKALIAVAVLVVVGSSALAVLDRAQTELTDWLLTELANPRSAVWIIAGVVVVIAGPLAALALFIYRLGQKVTVARRFPPPGHVVIRDTRIVTGRAALRRGRVLKALALLLLVSLAAASLGTANILIDVAAALQ